MLRDVELEREQAVGGVRGDEVGEGLGAAGGRDCDVAFLEDELGEFAAEAGGCASDYVGSQCNDVVRNSSKTY